jgi:hypothetical protein
MVEADSSTQSLPENPAARKRRPVTLVFGKQRQGSEMSMRALIDGGLARLIAARIATTLPSPGHHIPQHDSGCSKKHVTDRMENR